MNRALSKSNILFIINPISGGKDKLRIPELVNTYIDLSKFDPKFSVTEYVGHASELAEQAVVQGFDIIVAVGGDGTVNEVAAKVMQFGKVLGIIPFGSGNGLSRFLKIPMNPTEAIKVINSGHVNLIDTGIFNGKRFFNMAGMGFDAHISTVFAGDKSRGLSGYLKLGMKEILSYMPGSYVLEIDGREYRREAFVISVANSSQYGNNVHVSPNASITDGLLDVCIIKKLPLYRLPLLAFEMFYAGRSGSVEIIRGKRIVIFREAEGSIHIDGEPYLMGKKIEIVIDPLSLSILCP